MAVVNLRTAPANISPEGGAAVSCQYNVANKAQRKVPDSFKEVPNAKEGYSPAK